MPSRQVPDDRLSRSPTICSTPGPRQVRYAGAASTGLPPDLLQRASKRLGLAALIYAGTYFMAYFGAALTDPVHRANLLEHPATPVAAIPDVVARVRTAAKAWSALSPEERATSRGDSRRRPAR